MGLAKTRPFGEYHDIDIGIQGEFETPISVDELVARVLPDRSRPLCLIPGAKAELRTVAVVSGGAAMEALQAIDAGLDFYVTGESSHSVYHSLVEAGMGFLAAGHYATEVWGVKAVAERLARETGLKTLFIDLPTGL
jgi:putative NIF3 family GTP cyclohydrolase 1 type 2